MASSFRQNQSQTSTPHGSASASRSARPHEYDYYSQRQSTMDSETLDKLLVVEKNLFDANQATAQVWKLVGHYPENNAASASTSTSTSSSNANANANTNSMAGRMARSSMLHAQVQAQVNAQANAQANARPTRFVGTTVYRGKQSASQTQATSNSNANPNPNQPQPQTLGTTSSKIVMRAAQTRRTPTSSSSRNTPFSGSPESVFAASGISFASSASTTFATAPRRSQFSSVSMSSMRRLGNDASSPNKRASPGGAAAAAAAATSPSQHSTRSPTENGSVSSGSSNANGNGNATATASGSGSASASGNANNNNNSNGNETKRGGAHLTGDLDSVFGANGISFGGSSFKSSSASRGASPKTPLNMTSNRERCLPLLLPSNDPPALNQQTSSANGSGRHFTGSPHSVSSLEIPRRETRSSFAAVSPSGTAHRTLSSCGSDDSDPNSRTRPMVSQNVFGFNGENAPSRSDSSMLSFTVKKTDTVFDSWSKRSTLLLQVDLETSMLHILSTLENRESHSCAAVTLKPQARLGMNLVIVNGNTTVTKKIAFLSQEDRNNFASALDQAKIKMTKKSQLSYRPFSDEDDRKYREINENFTPLPGENVLEVVQRVTNLVVISQSDRAVHGLLRITTYRIMFAPYDTMWKMGSFELPLAAIDTITRDGLMLLINSKDLRTIRLAMHDAYTRKKGFDQNPQAPDLRWLNQLMLRMKPPNVISSLFAFDYFAEKKQLQAAKQTRREDGWLLYSPIVEYRRLGFLRSPDAANAPQDPNQITWRLLKNNKFRFSPTYPQLMVVPSLMSEEQLVQSARFRSRARLPTVVWRHPVSKCVLARSSQPNYGMTGSRSEPDRILLKAFRDSANKNSTGVAPRLHIIDARKIIATRAYRVRGKGVENSQHYDNASIEFMGIANIHKMRESLEALKALVSPNSVDDGDKHYHNRLENTRWLKHVMRVLSGAKRVAKILHEDGASVLVHCSDGWDRTPQLVGLAQLILDPYYRTIRGFAVLIEKEWCSFGHKFADRVGVGKDPADQPNERSPVMLQFLDCVWQMLRQFPTAFEFNERLLLHVSDALISGLYGTFLYNSERERVLEKVWERTESVWTPVLERPDPFKNPMFRATNCVLYPRANLKRVVLWDAMFFRWDPESNPDYMGYMDPTPDDDEEHHDDSISDGQLLPVRMPSTVNLEETEFKPLSVEIDELDTIHDMQLGGALSDCSSMSDDEDDEQTLSYANETAIPYAVPLPAVEDASLVRLYRQAEDRKAARANAREQMRSIREAIKLGPDESRIRYLEQLLTDSVDREHELEDELEATYQRVKMQRAGFSASSTNERGGDTATITGSEVLATSVPEEAAVAAAADEEGKGKTSTSS